MFNVNYNSSRQPILLQVAAEKTSKTVTFTCEEDYTMVGTECYFISPESHAGSSADTYCTVKGGHAAIIESQEEMDLLKGKCADVCLCGGLREERFFRIVKAIV